MSIGQETEDGENFLSSKLKLIDFGKHQKVIHGLTKLFMTDLLSNGRHEKLKIYF